MSDHEERRDPGEFYPDGKVWKVPGHSGGGGTIDLDDTVTETGVNGVKSKGIWSWVKSLLPSWLTANYDEPASVESVNQKYTKPNGGIPRTDLDTDVNTSLGKADTASQPGHTHTQGDVTGLAYALDAKRGKDDLVVYPKAWITKGLPEGVTVTQGPEFVLGTSWMMTTSDGGQWEAPGTEDDTHIDAWTDYMGKGYSPVCDLEMLAKTSQLSPNDYTDADKAEVAKVKDKADEFTEWEMSGSGTSKYSNLRVEVHDDDDVFSYYLLESDERIGYRSFSAGDVVDIEYFESIGLHDVTDINATRKRVLRTGEALAPGLDDDGVPIDPNVRDLLSESDTLLMGLLPYPLNTDGTIKDRAINVVTSGAFVIPQGFKDLLIRYTGIITSLTFTGGEASYGDNLPTDGTATSEYLITVTKIKSGEAYVRIIGLEARS